MKPTFKAQQFQQTVASLTRDGKSEPYTRTSISVSYVSACGYILVATDICEERPKEWEARVYVPADEFGLITKTFATLQEAVDWAVAEMPKHTAIWKAQHGKVIDLPALRNNTESEADNDEQ